MAHGGFEHLPQNDDFLMHRAPGRRLSVFLHRFLVAVNAVFLYLAGRDLGQAHVAEERHQVKLQPRAVALYVFGVTLALGDDLVFAVELVGGFAEGLSALTSPRLCLPFSSRNQSSAKSFAWRGCLPSWLPAGSPQRGKSSIANVDCFHASRGGVFLP